MLGNTLAASSRLIQNVDLQFVNRTGSAIAAGDVKAIDLTGSASEATAFASFVQGTNRDEEHPFANLIDVAAAHDDGWLLVVALEAFNDNAWGKCRVCGVVDVKIADSISAGARLAPTTGTNLVAEADGLSNVGLCLEGNSSGGVALRKCIFDGYASLFGPQSEV